MDLKKIVVPLIVVALLVAAAFTCLLGGKETKTLTAHFPRTVSIYEGSDVRVLGVPIGTVDTVTPSGTDVVVTMSYDAEVKVPEDAAAVIVSPSIVGDRFVQLTPVYTDGPVLDDGATLQADRTAVPLELDQIYQSLDDLTVALGPNGANAKGALTDLLETTAANFGGQGAKFHQTIEDFSQLTGTLDDNKEELFGSAEALEGFIKTLARNDKTVRQFNQSLASVSQMLAGERDELAASLRNLAVAMKQVSGFVKENREILGSNIKGLNRVAKVLVKQRDALDEILTRRPDRAEQPRPDLQPAGRHPRHPRQHPGARPPDRERPGHVAVRHRQPGRPSPARCATSSRTSSRTCPRRRAWPRSARAVTGRRTGAGAVRPDPRRAGGCPMNRRTVASCGVVPGRFGAVATRHERPAIPRSTGYHVPSAA